MKTKILRVLCLFLLSLFLDSCDLGTKPILTSTPSPPTVTSPTTHSPTPTTLPTLTPTQTLPASTSTPEPTSPYSALTSQAATPTPPPGWLTYTNDFMGYSFHYPSFATIYEGGAEGMDVNEIIPPGFTYDQYFDYVLAILPDKLCVTLQAPGIWITITPPYDLVGKYIGPCPGMGIGSQYRFEEANLSFSVAGHKYTGVSGTRLYLESTDAFYGEFYRLALPNGFRVTLNSRPSEGMSDESYLARRAQAIEIISTLHWFHTPGFAKLGTTCAGSYTRLLPGVQALVTGEADDPPNRARSGPGTAYEILFQVYPGTVVKVLEGPVCADGLVFWKVMDDTIEVKIGWTAEGNGTDYWLEPYKP